MVLEHGSLTDFGGIPMSALRENSLTELDLNQKGFGVPGAFVLAGLLPAATALKSCRCAPMGVYDRPLALVIVLWMVTVVVLSRRMRAIGLCVSCGTKREASETRTQLVPNAFNQASR